MDDTSEHSGEMGRHTDRPLESTVEIVSTHGSIAVKRDVDEVQIEEKLFHAWQMPNYKKT